MIVPKADRKKLYEYLFREGVCVAPDNFSKKEHKDIGIANLYVVNLMKSLVSKGLVRHQYSWKYHYWYLKDEGLAFLREYLNLPEDVVPKTHKVQERDESSFSGNNRRDDRRGGDRDRNRRERDRPARQ